MQDLMDLSPEERAAFLRTGFDDHEAQRCEVFISCREAITRINEATSASLRTIAQWFLTDEVHVWSEMGWDCVQLKIIDGDTGGAVLGNLLQAISRSNGFPASCSLECPRAWGPDNIGWRRTWLKKLLQNTPILAGYKINLSLSPEFLPKEPPVSIETTANTGRWPWGSYETDSLRKLAMAASKFWTNYDPNEPDTAPTNDMLINFLRDNGVTKRIAEAMATILRDENLPPGPRPK